MRYNPSKNTVSIGDKQLVYFQLTIRKKVRILVSDPAMTIGWLYCECMRKLIEAIDSDTKDPDLTYKPEDFIMLKTVKKIHNLDFYLTQHDQ